MTARRWTRLVLIQVRDRGGVGPLLREGLFPSQIAEVMRDAEGAGLLERDREGRLELSDQGRAMLSAGPSESGWVPIRPLDGLRRDPMLEEEVYLPERSPR